MGYESTELYITAALRKTTRIGELFSSAIIATVKDVRRER